MNYRIPLSKPYLTNNDFLEIKKCFDSSWISSKSPWVEKFEKSFAIKISQTKYAVAVNSGTSALFLALKALEIGYGDEVILPTLTMIATINAVIWTGAQPVLVDCQSTTDWNMSLEQVRRKITKKTKAIIPVHIYGYPCQMDDLMIIAKKNKLYLIEDAAEAMGARFKNKLCGSFGDVSCFSLYVNKIITTGNGGVVATNFKKIYRLIKQLSFFDFNPKIHFFHHKIGYNLVLSGIQAALGFSQIKKFDSLLKKRKEIFIEYQKNLKKNDNFYFINPSSKQQPNYWFPALIFKSHHLKKKAKKNLEENKIETRDFFLPLHQQPVYSKLFKNERLPVSEYFYKRGLLLPSYYQLTNKEIELICEIINSSV